MELIIMANRPVFISVINNENNFVDKIEVDFTWHPGFSKTQKQKSIRSLHENFFRGNYMVNKNEILEISTKSPDKLGVELSAFNLEIELKGIKTTVESLFQSSKVFENGGPYRDIIKKPSLKAKRDNRIRNSGELIKFRFNKRDWPLEPKTIFYDWIYMKALSQNELKSEEIMRFRAFTDIEFNPKKSINCQARAAALFISFKKNGMIKTFLSDIDKYLDYFINNSNEQLKLI
jgi:type I restriction enzyme M protein